MLNKPVRRVKIDPWKFEVYERRGPRSYVGWAGWSDGRSEDSSSLQETYGMLKIGDSSLKDSLDAPKEAYLAEESA